MDSPDNTFERLANVHEIKNATVSIWTNLREFWQRSEVKQFRLEGFVLLTGLLLGSILLLGSLRQRTARPELRFCLRAAYYLSGHALSYVMGVMNDSPVRNGLVVVWAVILLVLYGTADNVGSESLGDNEARRKRFLWDYMIPTLWFLALLVFTVPPQRFGIPVVFLLVLFLLKLRERKLALMCACRSRVGIDRVTRVIAEFMKYEYELSRSENVDASTMQGYKYLVGVKEAVEKVISKQPPRHEERLDLDHDKVVTIEKIWQCNEWVLAPIGNRNGPKDACLSFALFWLLLRRFADYDLAELSSEEPHSRLKAWNFVRHGLIKESDDEGACERTFGVVEVELDFLYDYFYNNYYAVYSRGGTRYLLVRLAVVGLYFVVSFVTLKSFSPEERALRPWYDANNVQILVTQIVIYALIAIELAQMGIILTSNWVMVKWVCKYIQNRRRWQPIRRKCMEYLLYMVCNAPSLRSWCKPWQRKLRQYSLLESYGHTPKLLRLKWIFDGYLDLPTDGQRESKPIKLSIHVMKAVIGSLSANEQSLSNGKASLHRNEVEEDELPLAFRSRDTSTHIVLIWHIATSICDMARSRSNDASNFHVATSLSKYCAYLVAFAPKLLPDHVYVTQCLFEEVVSEARETFKDCRTKEAMFEMLTRGGEESAPGSILKQGILLGNQLMNMIENDSRRWKVLADFWAEFILFLAPSKDAEVHAEYLVSGGEFITHLWALLTHAGIVSRDGHGG